MQAGANFLGLQLLNALIGQRCETCQTAPLQSNQSYAPAQPEAPESVCSNATTLPAGWIPLAALWKIARSIYAQSSTKELQMQAPALQPNHS